MNINVLLSVNDNSSGQIEELVIERNKLIIRIVEIDKMIATLKTIKDIAEAHAKEDVPSPISFPVSQSPANGEKENVEEFKS